MADPIPTTTQPTPPQQDTAAAPPRAYRRCDRCGTCFALGRVNSTGRICWHCKTDAEKAEARTEVRP